MSDLHVLSGSYALDALNEVERTAFEQHLHTCSECAVAVVEFHEVTAFLGGKVALVPSDRLRTAVLARVSVTRQLPVAGRVPLRRWSWSRIVATAATAVAIAGSAGLAGASWTGERAGAETEAVASAAAERATMIAQVLAAPDRTDTARTVAGGSMHLLAADGAAVLVATGMPAAGKGNSYQVWLFDDKGVRPVELLEVRDGFGQALVPGAAVGSTVAVSVEPASGSSRPTTEPFLKLRVT